MPSKRTNDSVDRILEELGRKQNEDVVRTSVNDLQVEAILKSLGLGSDVVKSDPLGPISASDMPDIEVPGGPVRERFPTAELDSILGDLPSAMAARKRQSILPNLTKREVPQPEPPKQEPVAAEPPKRQPMPEPRKAARPAVQPEHPAPKREPVVQNAPQQQQEHSVTRNTEDTVRTSAIKDFLRKMTPEGITDTLEINRDKKDFQSFFGETVAVVPDAQSRMGASQSKGKKHGWLHLPKAQDTGSFEPIRVQPDDVEDDYGSDDYDDYFDDLDEGLEENWQEERKPHKKGWFGGLFSRKKEETDTFDIPEPRAETVQPVKSPLTLDTGSYTVDYDLPVEPSRETENFPQYDDMTEQLRNLRNIEDETTEITEELPLDTAEEYVDNTALDMEQEPDNRAVEPTLAILQGAVLEGLGKNAERAQPPMQETAPEEPQPDEPEQPNEQALLDDLPPEKMPTQSLLQSDRSMTSTIYRKKRDTIEYEPHRGKKQKNKDRHVAPTNTIYPGREVPSARTGFTVRMDPAPNAESTQAFLADYGRQMTAEEPELQPETQPMSWTQGDVAYGEEDALGHTLTGQVKLNYPIEERPAAPAPAPQPEPKPEPAPKKTEKPVAKPDKASFVSNIADSINLSATATIGTTQKTETATGLRARAGETAAEKDARYGEAVEHLLQEKAEEPEKGKHRIRLGGTPDDEKENTTELPFDELRAPRHEYESKDDEPQVRKDLQQQVLVLGVTSILLATLGIILTYFGAAAVSQSLPLPAVLDVGVDTAPLVMTTLVMLLVGCALGWRTLWEGLRGMVTSPSPDSMPTLAALGAVVQLVAYLVRPEWYNSAKFSLLAGPALLLLCCNTVGKWLDAGTVAANFELVSAGVDHAVAYRLRDNAAVRNITVGLAEPRPCVLVSRPTQLLRGFLSGSMSHRTSDKNQQQFAWLLAGCGLVSFIFTLLYRKDVGMAVMVLAEVFCIGAPLAGTLISAIPARMMQRSAAQVGAVIPGWKDIRQLGRINVIQVTTRDLFPVGCVKLCGIRPVNKERIDLSIVYATSMLVDGSANLREVFMGMTGDNRKLLLPVDDRQNVYGKGVIGWIKGERVLVGNRHLMQDYNVEIPSLEYEQRHTVNQRRVIYLAVSGKLYAMFQVSYERDPDTAFVLDSLRRAGLSLLVDCEDFNCDNALLETTYGLPTGTVKVLTGEERESLAPATAWLPESEGNMLHLGSFASYVGGLEAAAGAAEGERKAAKVLSVSVVLGCVLGVLLSLAGGIVSLSLPALILYQAAWAVMALVLPVLQRY